MWKFVCFCVIVIIVYIVLLVTLRTDARLEVSNIECVPITNCTEFVNLLKKRPLSPSTIEFIRSTNCGFDGEVEKVWCTIMKDEPDDIKGFITQCTTPNGDEAFCLEIEKCHLFKNEVINSHHQAYDFIQASNCAPKGKKLKICCGKHKNYLKVLGQQESVNEVNPLPTECGKQQISILGSRIFGGTEASIGEFPWMGRIVHRSKYGYKHFGCSVILIHRLFVLTAAHCVESKALEPLGEIFQIVLGDHDMDKDVDCLKDDPEFCSDDPVYVQTGKPQVYSGYDNASKDHTNDIAIIPLKYPVKFSNFIQPLCLTESMSNIQSMWISGWGRTETEESSNVKRKVEVPRVNTEKCYDRYISIGVGLTLKKQLCAGGTSGVDSCTGDSGGPLMVEVDGKWYAEGIVSFGVGCGREGWPGVYTNIPYYVNWIKKTINRKLENKRRKIQSRLG